MQVQREVGHAPQTVAIAKEVYAMNGHCVGCTDCTGLCADLLDLMVFPDIVLRAKYSK